MLHNGDFNLAFPSFLLGDFEHLLYSLETLCWIQGIKHFLLGNLGISLVQDTKGYALDLVLSDDYVCLRAPAIFMAGIWVFLIAIFRHLLGIFLRRCLSRLPSLFLDL